MAVQRIDAQAAVQPDVPLNVHSPDAQGKHDGESTNGAGMKMPEQARAVVAGFAERAERMRSLGRGNVDSFMTSGRIWGAGCQEMSKDFAATAKTHMGHSLATWKALARVTSVKEAMDLQTGHAKAVYGEVMAYSSKMADASMKLAERTIAPISAQVTHAVEKLTHKSI